MSLTRLWSEVTEEELILWSCYFSYLNEQEQKQLREAKKRRR